MTIGILTSFYNALFFMEFSNNEETSFCDDDVEMSHGTFFCDFSNISQGAIVYLIANIHIVPYDTVIVVVSGSHRI